MATSVNRKERTLIQLFLSAYERDAWRDCALDWLEDVQDSAVELRATKRDGTTLALEHTLIQPFVGEKFDSKWFERVFSRIEMNPALVIPERNVDVTVPVKALPPRHNWDSIGDDLLDWLIANSTEFPKGRSDHKVVVGHSSKHGVTELPVTIHIDWAPGSRGNCLISRCRLPQDLGGNVEKALRTKLPKLVRTPANKRILLFERDQICLGDMEILAEIEKHRGSFPDLSRIDEIWLANTAVYQSEGWVCFSLVDWRGLVESMIFENDALKSRRDDWALLAESYPNRSSD
ncbi:MAG: hypothetical protein WBQ34_15710 [Candidatus Acidiferrales bacterium]